MPIFLICIVVATILAIVQISRVNSTQDRQIIGHSQPKIGIASWYSEESCKREGTSGICANGEVFDDERLTCASWDYRPRTRLLISNRNTGAKVVVEVTDRGPAKRLYRMGRIVDLSKAAFARIADLERGLAEVQIEELKREANQKHDGKQLD